MRVQILCAATAAVAAMALTSSAAAATYNGLGGAIGDATTDIDFNTLPTTTRFDLFVPDHGPIVDFQAVHLDIAHTWVGDLFVTLTHQPSGAMVTLVDRPGVPASAFGNSNDFNGLYSFQDAFTPLPETAEIGGDGIVNVGTWGLHPGNVLDTFHGVDGFGTWTLAITDNALGDTGALSGWSIQMDNVPAPGAMALLGLAAAAGQGRRRRA